MIVDTLRQTPALCPQIVCNGVLLAGCPSPLGVPTDPTLDPQRVTAHSTHCALPSTTHNIVHESAHCVQHPYNYDCMRCGRVGVSPLRSVCIRDWRCWHRGVSNRSGRPRHLVNIGYGSAAVREGELLHAAVPDLLGPSPPTPISGPATALPPPTTIMLLPPLPLFLSAPPPERPLNRTAPRWLATPQT